MLRTHNCGEITSKQVGESVTICWWVNKNRNLGWLEFIDLRDRYGITQITINPDHNLSFDTKNIKNEFVLQISGKVCARPENMINKNISTGEIEIQPTEIKVLSTCAELPFSISDDPKTSENNRFKYRYLDLRREKVLKNIKFRTQMNHFTRNRFVENSFMEIQTPIFTVSSPEWARDYLIPSRVNPGKFYALPQAPQQYKQLLMVGGIDKYFQIAPCFRDEDPRADRHSCEFYQIDCEMSFVEQSDVYNVVEKYLQDLISTIIPDKKISFFQKIKYKESLDKYWTDKPDLRFDMHFEDFTSDFMNSEFSVFKSVANSNGCIKWMKLENKLLSRKEADERTKFVQELGAKWLAYMWISQDWRQWSIVKFFSESELQNIQNKLSIQLGDTVVFVADKYEIVIKSMWKLRNEMRNQYNLVNNSELWFVRVEDFPFFELNEDKWWKLDFAHNPFSYVKWWLESLNNLDPMELETTQYDLACNGFEILSGSIRNHDPKVLLRVFELAGMNENDIKREFGAMYDAFQYWPPPHWGFAIGFDRLMMILLDEENIRECYAFPKSWKAEDVMMWAPAVVKKDQLDEIFIEIKKIHKE